MASKEKDRISPVHSRTRRIWKRGPWKNSSQTAQETPYAYKNELGYVFAKKSTPILSTNSNNKQFSKNLLNFHPWVDSRMNIMRDRVRSWVKVHWRFTKEKVSLRSHFWVVIKAKLMSPLPTILKNIKKATTTPHFWSILTLKGLKVLKNKLLSLVKGILFLWKKTLLLKARKLAFSKTVFFSQKKPF